LAMERKTSDKKGLVHKSTKAEEGLSNLPKVTHLKCIRESLNLGSQISYPHFFF
jgi:hypothetical protein